MSDDPVDLPSGSVWSDLLIASGVLGIAHRTADRPQFEWLMRQVPTVGSKISWDGFSGQHRHEHVSPHDVQEQLTAIGRLTDGLTAEGAWVVHIGDFLSPCGLAFQFSNLDAVAAVVLEIPEDHYFVPQDGRWCLAVSFEGDIDLGFLDPAEPPPGWNRPESR